MISDTELLILIQSYEAIGPKSRSINQNWVLESLLELQKYRAIMDKLIAHFGVETIKEILGIVDVLRK